MLNKKTIGAMLGAMVIAVGSLSADTVHPNGCKGPDLCTSNPVIDSCGWSFEIGLIAEQMRISNTDVFYVEHGDGEGTVASPTNQTIISNLDFDLDPGLRIGVGYDFNHDDWVARANFEWMQSTGNALVDLESERVHPTHVTYIPSSLPTAAPDFRTAVASLSVNYYLLDISLARGSYLSGKFSYEPFAGIKASWLEYKAQRRFSNAASVDRMAVGTSWLNYAKTGFWGVGPMIGMNGNYYVCSGWSLFSVANFSVLFGETTIADFIGFVTTEPIPTTQVGWTTLVSLCPTLRTIIGLQYDQDVMNEKQHFSFRAGFDARYYFNQYPILDRVAKQKQSGVAAEFELTHGPETIENGSFGMLGLILDVGYEF